MSKTESRFVDFRAVKMAVSMEQVLARYGVLDQFKRGRDSLTGPCPIHKGTNPTQFRVSLSKNCWNCFSQCHCGGNVLDFVARMEDVDPVEAANRLISWFQLDRGQLNAEHSREPQPAPGDRREARSAPAEQAPHQPASTHADEPAPPAAKSAAPAKPPKEDTGPNKPLGFQLELDPSHPYLAERGLTPETIDEFGLGYCERGVMMQRIAIPIHNGSGELVGYAGRWPGDNPPDGRPKYRLPDGFKKALEIYRFAHAMREAPEQPLVIVEGFFDAMRLWQLGVRKVVALMGSSLSEAQEALLVSALKPSSTALVMFDEDDAGREGRADVLHRLAPRAYVRVAQFAKEGFAAKDLTAEEAQLMGVLVS
jgi:DNA primase